MLVVLNAIAANLKADATINGLVGGSVAVGREPASTTSMPCLWVFEDGGADAPFFKAPGDNGGALVSLTIRIAGVAFNDSGEGMARVSDIETAVWHRLQSADTLSCSGFDRLSVTRLEPGLVDVDTFDGRPVASTAPRYQVIGWRTP